MGNYLQRSFPTMTPLGCLRKRTGRNEIEPICSVVTDVLSLVKVNGSVEPLSQWRKLERSIAGQETYISAGRLGFQDIKFRILPEDNRSGMGWLPGVPGMACVESIYSEAWEIPLRSLTRKVTNL